VFDDSAATSITAGSAPFTGSFKPTPGSRTAAAPLRRSESSRGASPTHREAAPTRTPRATRSAGPAARSPTPAQARTTCSSAARARSATWRSGSASPTRPTTMWTLPLRRNTGRGRSVERQRRVGQRLRAHPLRRSGRNGHHGGTPRFHRHPPAKSSRSVPSPVRRWAATRGNPQWATTRRARPAPSCRGASPSTPRAASTPTTTPSTRPFDNCPDVANPDQARHDFDGGDACDVDVDD
jgi:hypothetical protein